MREDWITFARTHKHLIYGNRRPQLRNVDVGIRSRLKIVPFKAWFRGGEDAGLPSKLKQECGYLDGVTRKIHKLEAKLGNLPKHTRTRTVDRLEAKLQALENEWAYSIFDRFGWGEALRHGLVVGEGIAKV